ncbi:unnamed protein product [Rhizoctonia solani]|uniref:N-acetyltransferase domain-containing protein n=1 Tax=Rhizoctonia solani TaxID=456999 RepID=A0A8H3AMP6_9AGAM|nr:unnamed protein product [Rhizoctonia solani]
MPTILSTPPLPCIDAPARHVCFNGNVTYKSITSDNIEILKAINWDLFSVSYPDAYYAATMRAELTDFCKLIYLDDIPVGQITCTFKSSADEGEARLYVMLMGVLPPYRSLGLGGQACQVVLQAAEIRNHRIKSLGVPQKREESTLNAIASSKVPGDTITQCSNLPITSVFLHVHVLNTAARRLYERYGFTQRERLKNFYRKRGPDDKNIKDAWLLELNLSA